MRRRSLALVVPALLAASSASAVAANGAVEEDVPHDARLEGYRVQNAAGPIMINPPSGAAGTWFLTALLGVICFGVMCKNGKRTHLD